MPAPVPSWAAAVLLARESATPVVAAITLTHPMWGAPIRLVRDTQALVSRGDTYQPAYFEVDCVSDTDEAPRATLAIPNVDRRIGEMVLRLNSPPEVAIEVVSLDHPDEPVYRAPRLELRNVNLTDVQASGDLVARDYAAETCGTIRITPGRCPAMFRGQ